MTELIEASMSALAETAFRVAIYGTNDNKMYWENVDETP